MRKIERFFLAASILCFVASGALVAHNLWESAQAARAASSAAAQLQQALPPPQAPASQPVSEPEQEELPQALPLVTDPDTGLQAVELDGLYYMGRLELPTLDLELPVQSSWSYPKLKRTPCRYTGSAETGDLILMAHNYEAHFGRLRELGAGDVVVFTDVLGQQYTYKVLRVETLEATAIEEMQSGSWELTLFTCTVGGNARVTVRCRQVSAE